MEINTKNEIKSILLRHASRYAKMQPSDAVKLLYQNEFGGGHLISDRESARKWLFEEINSAKQNSGLAAECIGGGFVRVYLSKLNSLNMTAEELLEAFCLSAEQTTGTLTGFIHKLNILESLTASHQMPFSIEQLKNYLDEYKQAGYPMVSHSEQYRNAYSPAYRVILQKYIQ